MTNYILSVLILLASFTSISQNNLPHLIKTGNKTQLIVNGKPYMILGGELGNSTATSIKNMVGVWPKLKAMNLNTILVPVYWELIEPKEGNYDFSLYKNLILEARKQNLKIVFLWFGAWKNSMSSHAPAWVKMNQNKYPRAQDQDGKSQEIVSTFSENVLNADIKIFEKLMAFIKNIDSLQQTVIMVQVENEIGMLPSARDHQQLAELAYNEAVPIQLIEYLQKNKSNLLPETNKIWKEKDYKIIGNWETIFGKSLATDELFMAYYYSKFTNKLTESGKKIYPIPMFVNAALNRAGALPGNYPSAGPLPHLMDIWKAAGTSIDFLSPDFYNPNFKYWCDLYTRQNDPLFVPEHVFDATTPAKALFTFGQYEGLGFSPFSIESQHNETLAQMYKTINSAQKLFFENQGKGKIKGVLLSKIQKDTSFVLGKYLLTVKHDYTLSWTAGAKTEEWPMASAMIIQTGENEYYILGTGVVITHKNNLEKQKKVGLLKVDEGKFENDIWQINRHLNGDQTHQGRHVNIPTNQMAIQKVQLYNYD